MRWSGGEDGVGAEVVRTTPAVVAADPVSVDAIYTGGWIYQHTVCMARRARWQLDPRLGDSSRRTRSRPPFLNSHGREQWVN